MKKQFSIWAVATALLVGVSACSKNNGDEIPSGETGSLKLSVGFTAPTSTRAGTSTAKPTTDWGSNIKSLQLLLVNGSNVVAYAHNVNLTSMTPLTGLQKTYTILNTVPAGTFTMYLIANNMETSTVSALYPGAYAGTASPINVGTNISTALINLNATGPAPTSGVTEAIGSKNTFQPNEIFWAKSAGTITIAPDAMNTPAQLDLTRAVGMLRVRINKFHKAVEDVDFAHASAGFRVRNIGWGINASTNVGDAISTSNTIVALGGFKTAGDFTTLLPTNYVAGGTMGVVADPAANDYTYWSDYLCFPGGASTGANRFNIVIAGFAPEGYTTADGSKIAAGGGVVYWTGPVNAALAGNAILEMNVDITTPGIGGPTVPPVGTFGDLTIDAKLIEWGNISSVSVPM